LTDDDDDDDDDGSLDRDDDDYSCLVCLYHLGDYCKMKTDFKSVSFNRMS